MLTGTADAVDDSATRTLVLAAADLYLDSGNGGGNISLTTTVTNLDAAIGANDLTVNEADGITLRDVAATSGLIDVNAGGAVTATLVDSSSTAGDANDIAIDGSSIDVVQVLGGAGQANDVTLNATGGAITDSSGGSTGITGDVLTSDAAGAMTLDTAVASIDAAASAAGNITITEVDGVTLTDVSTSDGAITVTAGGAVTATLVDSSNTAGDANDIAIDGSSIDVVQVLGGAGQANDVTLNATGGAITDGGSGITGDVLTADAAGAMTLDTAVASIDAATSAAGDITITESDAVTLNPVTSSNGNISATTANGEITVAGLVTANSGTLTLTSGGGAGDHLDINAALTGDAGVTLNAADTIEIGAGITTSNGNVTVNDQAVVDANVTITTGAGGGGNVVFNNTLDGPNDLDITAGTGNISFTNSVGSGTPLGALTITSAADVTFSSTVEAASVVQSAGSGTTLFSDDVTTSAAAGVDITATNIALDNATMLVDASGDGPVRLNGAVELRGAATTLDTTGTGDITFTGTVDSEAAESNDLTLGAGTGSVVANGAVGSTRPLGAVLIQDAADVTFSSTVEAASVVQSAGTGTSLFSDDVTTSAAAGVNITATNIALDNATMLVDASGDGPVRLNGAVEIRGAATTLDTTGTGDITFTGTVDSEAAENNDLTLGADTGSVVANGAVGSTRPLGAVLIQDAADVTFSSTVEAASLDQQNGTGTTLLTGLVTTSGAAGIDLGSAAQLNNVTISGGITTTGGGPLRINASGTVDLNDTVGPNDTAADFDMDGSFTLEAGAASVQLEADIVTTGDAVDFNDAIDELTGDTLLSSGGAAGGALTFTGTIDDDAAGGPASDYFLAVNAGTADLNFNAGVGATRALNHLRILGGNNLNLAAATTLRFQDLYIDANIATTLTLPQDLTLNGRLIFFRGTLDVNGMTITTGGDVAVFGTNYDENDADRNTTSPANTFFAYPGAALAFDPGAAAYDAAFADLTGSTIDVGGDFYNNGSDMTGTGNWTLDVPGNVASTWLTSPYAAAFNMQVAYSQVPVTSGSISAAEGVTDSLNNTVYVPDPDGPGPGTHTPGWDFTAPDIASAQIVKDNLIRITFNEPIENSNNEISAAAASLEADGGADPFENTFVDNDGDDLYPFDLQTTDGRGDLTTFYLQTTDSSWATDANGGSASVSGTGTDRDGNSPGTTPNLSWIKGALSDAGGKNLVPNYNYNGPLEYSGTTDECRPVLHTIEYGRAAHNQPPDTPYDGHNYFHLYYSEPVDIGGNASMSAATPNAENLRAEDVLGDTDNRGGDIEMSGADVLVEGYFTYDDPAGTGPLSRGWRTGTTPANALYRTDTTADGVLSPFTTPSQELRIYLSGFSEGADGDTFPGWHSDVPDPAAATTVDVLDNTAITDALGNPVDHRIDPSPAAAPPGFAPDPNGTAPAPNNTDPWLNDWDVDTPVFSSYTVNFSSYPGTPTSNEIVSRATTVTQLVNRLEFHILDNGDIDFSQAADAGEAADPANNGLWDPQNLSGTAPGPLTHVNDRNNEGIRDATLNYPGDGLTEYEAITVEEVGITPLVNTYNLGYVTDVNNSLYGGVAVNVTNDSYMTLSLQDSGHPWGLITDLYVEYDHSLAYITDLAGNLLPSTSAPIAVLERTPPEMELALGAVGGERIYLQFSEPVWGDIGKTVDIDENDFTINIGASPAINADGFTVLERSSEGGGSIDGVMRAYLSLDRELDADDMYNLTIQPSGGTEIYDKSENPMPTSYVRRISDVGIGVIEPVWASDQIHSDSYGPGFESLKVFDGSGTLGIGDITLQASLLTTGALQNLPVSLVYDADVPDSYRTGDYWSPLSIQGLVNSPNRDARTVDPFDVTGALRTFNIPAADPEMRPGNVLEFQFRVGNLNAARIDNPDRPLTLEPWSFAFRGYREQRGGVTILNNVINPDNGENTVITYTTDSPGNVTVQVFTLDGNIVRSLQRGRQAAGTYRLAWDGKNMSGRPVARGVYYIRVVGPEIDQFRKVMIVK
ncbi:MAG: hypothetical protein K9L68_13180 [Spirochaetales bacterium]|nr:hypothetical protein [Spirochaetales bacterium]